MHFEARLEAYQALCNAAVEAVPGQVFEAASTVSEAARYSLLNGGKRVRGVLALAACDMLGTPPEAVKPFAAAIEMIHAFSLVHDDLPCMDDDDMRRGQPACHIRYGEANALLAGDLLSLQAFEVLALADALPEAKLEAVRVLAAAAGARGMIYGQELDLRFEKQPPNGDELARMQLHKTGALLRAAVQLGVCAAGRRPADYPGLTRYAEELGRVFQIVDDLLDVHSTTEVLGKPVGSDAAQGKTTFVSLFGEAEAQRQVESGTEAALAALAGYGEEAAFLREYARALASRVQ